MRSMNRRSKRAKRFALRIALASAGLVACAQQPPPPPAPPVPPSAFHVVALGDSYASGQGAPDEPWKWWKPGTPRWDDERCNRSRNAATAQAVEILRNMGHDVAYDSFACSGAEIEPGLIGPYDGSEPPAGPHIPLRPQVDELAAIAAAGDVDAVTLAIGGNDVLFAFIVTDCVAMPDCNLSKLVIDQKLAALPARFDLLAQRLSQVPISPERILLFGYPRPTEDDDGSYCDSEPLGDILTGVTAAESQWVTEYVLPRLNRAICEAAQAHGWSYVGAADVRFEKHGWCAQPQSWINTFEDALSGQSHVRGAVHPNAAGYADLGQLTATALFPLLSGQPPTTSPCPVVP